MITADIFSAVFEDLPAPALLFEPNNNSFTFITCNRQYELLGPVYRFQPSHDILCEAKNRLENIKLPPAEYAGIYWQAEYQPVISESKLTAIMCMWHKVNESPDDYVNMVSHEFKAPLTVLNTCLEVAANRGSSTQDKVLIDALEKSQRQLKRLQSIINGFLDVASVNAGMFHLDKEKFCLGDLLQETLKENYTLLQRHKLRLTVSDDVMIYADREKINSVIINLLANAVKYSSPGSVVEVLCCRSGPMALLSIRDEGIGITEDQLSRVFDRYYRADTLNISGSGIGLYLSSEIIRQHEGFLSAKSEPGKGSVFQFCIALSIREMDTAC